MYIWLRGKSNVSQYPWVKNWLYTLQRYTGLIAFAYIGWHLYTERWLTHGTSTYATVYAGFAESLVPDIFRRRNSGFLFPSRRGHLEFSLQVGTRGHRPRTTRCRAAGRAGRSCVQSGGHFDLHQLSIGLASFASYLTDDETAQNHRRGRWTGRTDGHHSRCRIRRSGRSVFHRAGEAFALRLRAGRNQRRQKSKRRRRHHRKTFRRHHLRRRFSGQSAAGQAHVRSRSRNHRSSRSHGRDVQSHAGRFAGLPPIWRHALSPHRVCRRNDRPATSLRAR